MEELKFHTLLNVFFSGKSFAWSMKLDVYAPSEKYVAFVTLLTDLRNAIVLRWEYSTSWGGKSMGEFDLH